MKKSATNSGTGVYQGRFNELYSKLHDAKNGYFSSKGIPYHSVETFMCEAPDYGHETTSEALSYYLWLEAMHGRFTGDFSTIGAVWNTMEQYMIPTSADQPGNSGYNPSKPATYAGEYELPDDYPSQLMFSVPVGKDPISEELNTAYSNSNLYGMHWLLDVDNWYGYGSRGDGITSPSYINTFQRGKQESVFETVPQPSWEAFKWGGPNGYLDLFTKDNSYSKQWRYTNAPDADARCVQAMYLADTWAKAQGGDVSTYVQKASKMGDYLRYSFFDKYFKKIGSQDVNNAGTGYDASHYLLSWYYAWGGGVAATWAWRIGCSHSHFGYQNPMAAWILSNNADFKPKSPNGANDWGKSLTRQIEFYQWLQSNEGAIAGGATNSYNGRYEKYPAGTATFYGMAYQENPVYADPGSNTWFGLQAWSMQRVAEYYYNSGDVKAKNILDKWIIWIKTQVTFNSDGTFQIPSTLAWTGQPDTWTGTYTGNTNLHVQVTVYSTDLGPAASLANALSYYSAATKKWTPAKYDDASRALAQKLLDSMWTSFVDEKGLSVKEPRSDYHRMMDQEVYIPSTFSGKMPDGDVIKPGVKFIDIRSQYKKDPDFEKVQTAYNSGEAPVFNYHRFWAQCEIAIANGTYGILFDNSPLPSSQIAVSITAPLDGQSFDDSTSYSPIVLNATAAEDGGSITKVDFFVNGNMVGESTTAPYRFSWVPSGYAVSSSGIDSFVITAKATDSSGVVGNSGAVNIKVRLPIKPVPVGNLQVGAYNSNTQANVNTISPKIKIANSGTTSINLSDVTLRYYFTDDGAQNQSFWCDWATSGSSSVTGNFVKLSPAVTNADYYLEIGFLTSAGTLAQGASFELASRFAKNDWSNFNQSNDYSFDSVSSSYSSTNKITAYIDGKLINGVEP